MGPKRAAPTKKKPGLDGRLLLSSPLKNAETQDRDSKYETMKNKHPNNMSSAHPTTKPKTIFPLARFDFGMSINHENAMTLPYIQTARNRPKWTNAK